ncbi:hypothetical protein DFJ43DRAFT_1049122 [Lentinula guzmanii]|uniref:LIM zinc-binding domain-containing protein n=1 Tax=Lentinula guzmanii TaxID=2804957 RepID=A0AA38JJN1_9AGAR|nr:hypothetical protein DFJ43DRAFT_1049122 [Lentinula guzmanii]
MGFCRRCGDIVFGTRCKCGGTAVAPAVAWKESSDPWTKTYVHREKSPTRAPQPSVNTSVKTNTTGEASNTSPAKRFPRPLSSSSSSSSSPSTIIGKRVTEHITASTSQPNRPPSPLKNSTVASPESGILPSLNSHSTGSLSKVYGSVLQPKESLASHACALCGTVFPPDSTIYPEPYADTSSSARFLCRDCFTSNGGAKGQCPGCSRPVLALKSEGPFIEAAGDYWHKACFTCEGCGKNIGDSPMMDLLGKPSCPECFDTCLKRDHTPKKRSSTASLTSPTRNLGGIGSHNPKSKEGSPTIDELEQRLGIVKSRISSPALEELSKRLSMISSSPSSRSPSPRRSTTSPSDSPLLNRSKRVSRTELLSEIDRRESHNRASLLIAQRTGSSSPAPDPTVDQIEEMKRRFMKSTPSSQASPVGSPLLAPLSWPQLRNSRSSGSLSSFPNFAANSSEPQTPDLLSDISDSATQSSVGPDSPPRVTDEEDDAFLVAKLYGRGLGTRYARSDYLEDDVIIEETNSQLNTPDNTPKHKNISSERSTPAVTPSKAPISGKSPSYLPKPRTTETVTSQPTSPSTGCAKCHKPLFTLRDGGRYVTVPDDITGTPQTYHTICFTCSVCKLEFTQGAQGQAAFVKGEKGPCHVECAPPAKITIHKIASPPSQPLPARRTHTFSKSVSSVSSPPSSPSSGAHVSSRYSRPPLSAPSMSNSSSSSSSSSALRFGTKNSCPGCKKSVPQVSFGISEGERSVQGPNGTRWHVMCLVCGGKKPSTKGMIIRGRDERKKDEPGCGKRLDSGAKTDGDSGVFCRECWLLLPTSPASPQWSPTRTPIVPSHTGSSGKVVPQYTGTTTLARQFTGLGGGDAPLLRQLTGGGLSPTRSLSPTKQLSGVRPRPKSVIGMRSSKSVDEGRGMRLVRQMTGSGEKD